MGRAAGAALAAAFLVLGVGAVIAQIDPIATRKGLMKENQDNAEIVVRMMRGQAPFDAAKVDAAFAQWADTAQKLPSLFPDNSKSGQKTRAAPKIWTAKADFDGKAVAFGKVVADNRDKAKGSVDGLRAAIPAIGNACDACHKDYRLSRQ
ncbi:MAG TPA: cytochrome c [Pseudolabrys sp.]|nr:cytochrome c [Pseudolabrys sp.]